MVVTIGYRLAIAISGREDTLDHRRRNSATTVVGRPGRQPLQCAGATYV
jgi:hypothetical protein